MEFTANKAMRHPTSSIGRSVPRPKHAEDEVHPTKTPVKRFETSKVALAAALTFSFTGGLVVIIGWVQGLPDAWQMLGAVLVPGATALGFYAWKAKAENLVKNARKIDKDAIHEILAELAKTQMGANGQSYYGY